MDLFIGLVQASILAGGVLALAALGEVLTERVGVVNLGVEGLMSLGAITGIATVIAVPSPSLGLLFAACVGFFVGMIFAAATVILRANQILCGLALTMIGIGLSAVIGKSYSGIPAPVMFETIAIPYLSDIPVLGRALFTHNILVYPIYIIIPFALHYLLFSTRHGLDMRAVGENPAAADSIGINVQRIRFWYVSLGGAFAAAGGAYLTLAFVPSWSEGVVAGRGWIAVALVIFAGYRPWTAVAAALLFGLVTSLGFVAQARNWPIAAPILSMMPYLGTIALMIVPVLMWPRMRRLMAAPAAIGKPFFRDVR